MNELSIILPDGGTVRKTADHVTIYGLIDPVTKELRYVGKADCPASRLRQHVADSRRNPSTVKEQWIAGIEGEPLLIVLGTCSDDEWPELETRWVALSRDMGASLTNIRDGGEGRRQQFMPPLPDFSRAVEVGCDPADLEELVNFQMFGHHFGGMSEGAMRAFENLIDRLPEGSKIDFGIRCLARASRIRTMPDSAARDFAATVFPRRYPHNGLLTVDV